VFAYATTQVLAGTGSHTTYPDKGSEREKKYYARDSATGVGKVVTIRGTAEAQSITAQQFVRDTFGDHLRPHSRLDQAAPRLFALLCCPFSRT